MRVNELRAVLEQYETAVLREIVVELYKKIPKNRKEDEDLDELLQNFSKEKAKATKKDTPVNFQALRPEVEQFIAYANEQYYFAPNRYVSKEKRSKWRFEVKRFIKELLAVGGEDSAVASELLTYIYQMLSYACNYYIFSTENPFSAVGYAQPELLSIVLGRIFYSGYDRASIKTAVFLTLDSNVDRNTLHLQLLNTLVSVLKTPDTKELALAECVAYAKEYAPYQAGKKVFRYSTKDDFRRNEHSNYATELYLLLKFGLYEYDDGIEYFLKHYQERDKEITLYCLLVYFLSDEQRSELWIREYEKAVAKGIKPRQFLQEQYKERKAKG